MTARTIRFASGSASDRGFLVALALALAMVLIAASAAWMPAARAADEAAFPLTVTDDEGTDIVIEALPQRIISLSPANTETVFALGGGDRLVGGTDFDDFPAEAAELPDVATFSGVVMERVVDLDPDLVLAAGNFFTPPDDIARMRDLGIPVVVVYADDVEQVLADIELIGVAIGEADAAEAMTAEMRAQLAAISEAAAAAASAETRPRTYYELDTFEGATFGPAPGSFVADMIELAGGEAVTTGDPVLFEMPLERLIVADPEVIVLGDAMFGVCPENVAARPAWSDISAVVSGAIRPVDGVPVTRPGPRLPQGLASLARAIHPRLELADFPPDPVICAA